jgi:Ca2+-binding EF-hand superfamily protein
MLSELQKRKFAVAFQLYDVDNDGYLEREDFIGFADWMSMSV